MLEGENNKKENRQNVTSGQEFQRDDGLLLWNHDRHHYRMSPAPKARTKFALRAPHLIRELPPYNTAHRHLCARFQERAKFVDLD
jgi:hypothetical protein